MVQVAWCPHLGADLSVGQIVDGRLRCAYHHWSFDGSGACDYGYACVYADTISWSSPTS